MSNRTERDEIRIIIGIVLSYDVHVTFRVEGGQIWSKGTKPLNTMQTHLIKRHREGIIRYLTTPPNEQGPCIRGHEPVEWMCTPNAIWVCRECYGERFVPIEIKAETEKKPDLNTFWMSEKGA